MKPPDPVRRGPPARALLRAFLGFAALSGIGWLLDFLVFSFLVHIAGITPFAANFVSSWVGVTFAWCASLRLVFRRAGRTSVLAAYWAYQVASILAYSQVLQNVAGMLQVQAAWAAFAGAAGIAAKIIVTPLNLLTNFAFVKFLTRSLPTEPRRGR